MPLSDETALLAGLGARLKQARVAAGLLGCDVARRAGVSRAGYSFHECGKKPPQLPYVVGYGRVLGVSLDWLVAGDGAPFAPLSPEEAALVRRYRRAGEHIRAIVRTALAEYPENSTQ